MTNKDPIQLTTPAETPLFSRQMWLIPLVLAIILILTSRYSFLLFHTLAEFIAISVALLMSVVAWQMYPFTRNNYLMYLGAGYFWIAVLDLMHTLSYKGMQVHELAGANVSTQYWIGTRILEALLLLSAPWFLSHRLARRPVFFLYGAIAITLIVLVSLGMFPETFVEGVGLTAFKVNSEYVIVGLLVMALLCLRRQRALLEPDILNIMSLSIVLTVFAELAFTFYIDVYDLSNQVGHIFKLFSFWLIFMATVHTTLQKPFQAMARGASTYDAIPNPTIVTDAEGIVRQANQAACDMVGLGKNHILGTSSHDLFHPAFMSPADCPVCLSRRQGKNLDACEIAFPDNPVWRDYTLSPLAGGAVEVIRDISEKKRVEFQYQELSKLKNTIVDNLPAMLFVKTAGEGRYVEWNKAAEELTGLRKDEVIGKTDFDLFPEEAEFFAQMDRQVLDKGVFVDIPEEPIHTRSQGIRLLHTQKIPIQDEQGRAAYLLGISLDITSLRNTEKMLQHSQKMEAIGQLAGGIAHDFNNQLGLVIGYLDFLKDFVEADPEATEWASISIKAARRCVDLTQQLLMFSRHHASSTEIIDINERIEEIAIMIERAVTPAITVQYHYADQVLLTETNPGELQDALLNLAINARDAMPEGGTFRIETRLVHFSADSTPEYPEISSGDYIRLSLIDTGMGMTADQLERIFEPFYTTKPKGKGTGLGLPMVYAFVHRYGGVIKVDSTLGEGSRFHIFLPYVSEASLAVAHAPAQADAVLGGNETLLVVEDEPALLRLASQLLREAGYHVMTATNATEALTLLRQHSYIDLLFSDIVMPGSCSGFELAEQARQLHPQLRILLTSGFATEKVPAGTPADWLDSLLKKPYRKQELLQAVRARLDSAHQAPPGSRR
ncbi:MAG: MASE3 domain-containing protein [Gammaproteobacteria bacterium]